MNKAPSIVVDEPTARRLKIASLIVGNIGVIPQADVDRLVTNVGREEIPSRLVRGFVDEVKKDASVPILPESVMTTMGSHPRIEVLRETPKPCAKRTADEQVAGMKTMYGQLGWSSTESGLVIPERKKGFDRLLVLAT